MLWKYEPAALATVLGSIALVTMVAISVPLALGELRRSRKLALHAVVAGFGGGTLFGLAFLHLLHDAQTHLSPLVDFPVANCCFVIGAFLTSAFEMCARRPEMLQVDLLSAEMLQTDRPARSVTLLGGNELAEGAARRRAAAMQLAVLVQSLLYALELPLDHGMAEEHNRLGDDPDKPTIIVITVIFAVHQAVMGFAAGVVITHAKLGRMTTIGLVLAQSIALPVGALCDLATAGQLGATSAGRAVQGVLGALAAGSVAYVASTDLLHDQTAGASNYAPRLPHSLSLCAGFGLMTALAFFD